MTYYNRDLANMELAREDERNRILGLLEEEKISCEKAGLWANDPELREKLQQLHIGLELAIKVIKGQIDDRG